MCIGNSSGRETGLAYPKLGISINSPFDIQQSPQMVGIAVGFNLAQY